MEKEILPEKVEKELIKALRGLDFGQVVIFVKDNRVVGIEIKRRIHFPEEVTKEKPA